MVVELSRMVVKLSRMLSGMEVYRIEWNAGRIDSTKMPTKVVFMRHIQRYT